MVSATYTKPIWTPPRGRYANNLWTAYSAKVQRRVRMYSDLEHDHWLLVEFDPRMPTFCEQPVAIEVGKGGEGRGRSVLDMWVMLSGGTEEFREVKYARDLLSPTPRIKAQLNIQKRWAEETGHRYRVVDEREIRRDPDRLDLYRACAPYLADLAQSGLPAPDDVLCAVRGLRGATAAGVGDAMGVHPSAVIGPLARLLHAGRVLATAGTPFRSLYGVVWEGA